MSQNPTLSQLFSLLESHLAPGPRVSSKQRGDWASGLPSLPAIASFLLSDDVPIRTWFPKENPFSFQTATTTMQA